jgi:hypothetical protein
MKLANVIVRVVYVLHYKCLGRSVYGHMITILLLIALIELFSRNFFMEYNSSILHLFYPSSYFFTITPLHTHLLPCLSSLFFLSLPFQLIGQYLALRKPISGSNMIGE